MIKNKTNKSVFKMIFENKVFAKCPTCNNYLCLFEFYNSHCNSCGQIDFNKIIIVYLEEIQENTIEP